MSANLGNFLDKIKTIPDNFYPNNFKFCAVKKNYKYLQ